MGSSCWFSTFLLSRSCQFHSNPSIYHHRHVTLIPGVSKSTKQGASVQEPRPWTLGHGQIGISNLAELAKLAVLGFRDPYSGAIMEPSIILMLALVAWLYWAESPTVTDMRNLDSNGPRIPRPFRSECCLN